MIDKLAFLVALSRERHFGRAAEACGVTQPTLSAGLKQLETTLGVLLVHRSGKFGGFTPEGERVLGWAQRIVSDARALREEVRALRHGLSGHLRLAVVPTATPLVARLTTGLRARHPGITFSVRSCSSHEVLAAMDALEADAGITYVDGEPVGRVRALPLLAESYRLLTARTAQFGDRDWVDWAELAALPLALLTTDMQNRRIIDRRLAAAHGQTAPALESNSMIVLMSHVQTGQWATILPALMAETLLACGTGEVAVGSVPIRDLETAPVIGLVYPLREPLLPLTEALLAQARSVFGQADAAQ